MDMRPDPLKARTPAELIKALAEFRQWAGGPSFQAIAEGCGQLVSASTLHRTLTGTALPSQKIVTALIIGCGGNEEDRQLFTTALRMIELGRRPAAESPGRARPLRAVPEPRTG